MGNSLGQPVVVENRPGGVGTIGLGAVARSAPDGYTFGMMTPSDVIAPYLVSTMPYDTERDLAAVSMICWSYSLVAVPTASKIRSFTNLIAQAKST